MQQQNEVLQQLKSQPASGRLVIHISADINSWANTPADIELRTGDVLTVPKRPGFVLVSGQVYNASAITYVPGKDGGLVSAARRRDQRSCQSQRDLRHSRQWLGHGTALRRMVSDRRSLDATRSRAMWLSFRRRLSAGLSSGGICLPSRKSLPLLP